ERVQQVGAADDTDHLRTAHHRQPLDAAAFHELHSLVKPGILGDRDRPGGHHVFDVAGMGMDIFLGETAWADQEFEPARPLAFGAGLAAAQEIALRDHADQSALLIDDWETADVVQQHEPDGFEDARFGRDRNHAGGHDIADFHWDTSGRL